jgi:hypothetical protein
MAELAKIRAGIAANIKARLPDVQCTGYLMENPYAPGFEVEIGSGGVVYDLAMSRGLDEWFFTIRGFAASGLDRAAQMRLDAWLDSTGSQSVKAGLEAAKTLPVDGVATVSDSRVVRVGQVRAFSPIANPGITFFGAEWVLRAIAPGD